VYIYSFGAERRLRGRLAVVARLLEAPARRIRFLWRREPAGRWLFYELPED
jgi:hypothetical protein